jgi:hypothetical protein
MKSLSWYLLTIAAGQVADGKVLSCRDEFEKAFAAARGPREMALFKRERDDGGVDLFFTPDCGEYARDLVDRWHCSPCERPSFVGLHLVVGHNEMTYYLP